MNAEAGAAKGSANGGSGVESATTPWHTVSAGEAARELEARPEGLTTAEAVERLRRFGPNVVEAERETPWWKLLLHQFTDPLIYILLVAAVVTTLLRDYVDTGVILAVVAINAVIGFVQEYRAQQAMRALARMAAPRATVLRDGTSREIPSKEVVPGDVVLLTSGVRIPADLRIVRTRELEVDESALTGESVPVRKTTDELSSPSMVPGDRTNMAFSGTVVTRGRGRGYVVQTGAATELGRIATAVREIGETRSPLQESMQRFGRMVGVVVTGLAAVTAILGLLRGADTGEIFLMAVALAVSAIPEGLPVVLTVTLAIGVSRMAGRNAIIRALPAVETLGSATVIGSDKTGTLTRNEMTVRAIWAGRQYRVTGGGYGVDGVIQDGNTLADSEHPEHPEHPDPAATVDPRGPLGRVLLAGSLANEAEPAAVLRGEPAGDPTEIALHVAAAKGGMDPVAIRAEYPELDMIPFESETRFMATLNEAEEGNVLWVKGAPEAILDRCDRQLTSEGIAPLDGPAVRDAAAGMATEGLRVLAMAYRPMGATDLQGSLTTDDVSHLVLAGLQGMEDPVRPEVVDAIRATHEAGIRVVMLTGDHVDTARAIGHRLGLDREGAGAVEGRDLDERSDEELDDNLRRTNVFARVAPEHKLRVVRRLREQGEVVAVTGDGVNDAPALREAHLGIAMGLSGTDVAKEASDMVLADDNFATITAAVEEGRVAFSNIRKVTFFLLSTAVGEVLAIMAAVAAGWPLPFVAAQILWVNLVTNGLQDVALAFEPGEPGLLRRPPRPREEGILTWRILERLGAVGLVLAIGTLGMFWWTLHRSGDLEAARTAALTQMVVFQFFHVFNCRSLDRSVFEIPLLSNRFLFASISAALLAHLAVLHFGPLQLVFRTQPLSLAQWGLILLVGSTVIAGGELDKWWSRRRHNPLG